MTADRIKDLLQMVREIADPAEEIRQKAAQIAQDAQTDPETAKACADLAATVEGLFGIAGYLLNKHRTLQ
ncbi:hypothetical protein ELG97_36995 [Rhizobium leguminosarum]|uniref:hypothetical protein n=1 Tax=Rhizobium leguminosarum TaxID=384 RepID=UPI00103117E7|nr:hypothetical protein [Rhizobium leguminosarum]TBE73830.1 hypothetical protein ELG97_36995 [Rhizobium leguminosarum]